jgi:hypothetical protein
MKAKMLDSSANQGAVIHLARESARTLRLRAEQTVTEERITALAEERYVVFKSPGGSSFL